jgi:prepilin-type processing-associated H-X9-DG protein
LPDPPRWDGRNIIAFLDGHAKATEGAPKVEIKLP